MNTFGQSCRFACLVAAAFAAGSALPAQEPSSKPPAKRPNIIVFLVDDMGWMDCGAYGSKYYETPNIDRFATRAMRFTDAYAQPLCSPTRASLLSGKYSARHGITSASGHQPPQPAGYKFLPDSGPPTQPMLTPESKNYLEPSETTLAEALHDAGYRTAHIGKWHLGLTREYWPERQGFDVAFHCHPDPGPPGNYFSPYGVKADGEPRGQARVGTITDGPAGEYIVDRLADEAVKFIESNRDRPFFLNLWNYGVHGPWGHKEAYTRAFAAKKDPRGEQGNPIMASMLKSVDECFGRILETLDRNGLADNTIVVFNSDNGGNVHSNTAEDAAKKKKGESPQLADWRKWAGTHPPTNNTPLRDGKGTLYEGGTRVPLMWSWPGAFPREPSTVRSLGISISTRRSLIWLACRNRRSKRSMVSAMLPCSNKPARSIARRFSITSRMAKVSVALAACGFARAIGSSSVGSAFLLTIHSGWSFTTCATTWGSGTIWQQRSRHVRPNSTSSSMTFWLTPAQPIRDRILPSRQQPSDQPIPLRRLAPIRSKVGRPAYVKQSLPMAY
ncbi:MAG: sulfatase [Myxococcales bacterium]